MNRRVLFGLASLALAVVVMALLYTAPSGAQTAPTLTISVTDKGIIVAPKDLVGGDHTVIVKNMTSKRRGVELTGLDKGGTAYVRYSKIIAKSKTDTFRWFFTPGETVYIKDVLRCEHAARGCVIVTFGGMKTAVRFR